MWLPSLVVKALKTVIEVYASIVNMVSRVTIIMVIIAVIIKVFCLNSCDYEIGIEFSMCRAVVFLQLWPHLQMS